MINYDEYKNKSLFQWFVEHDKDEVNGIIIKARIRGYFTILAISDNLDDLYYILGLSVLNSAIVECYVECYEDYGQLWCITIDLDKDGKFLEE